jgi:glycosyltransferase involved in cell wall biosynthesis
VTIRLTALAKYDRQAASTRQRLLQFVPALSAAGIDVDYQPLLGNDYVASLATGGSYSIAAVTGAYWKRLRRVAFGPLGDVVWVYAELFPYLPAMFERLLARRSRPIVYDLDDAFFLPYDEHPNPLLRAILGGKLEPLLLSASACTCGNRYLADYASRFCPNSIVLPTVVDTFIYRPVEQSRDGRPPVIGWIGSPSTWAYVRPLLPVLREICREIGSSFLVVGAGAAAEADRFPGMELHDWSESREIADIQSMDIGIMPVPDDKWARGKSGYKLIQYMACGLPVVASPVGVNREIVRTGENGFLATTQSDWRMALARLSGDAELRRRMGECGRERAVADYSLAVHAPRLVRVIRSAALGGRA